MIDLTAAKAHLRVDTIDEDSTIQIYLNAALAAVQDATGKPFVATVFTQTLDGFPPCNAAIRLWKGPVADTPAPAIAYDDENGSAQTLADFRLVEGGQAAGSRLLPAYGASWPTAARGPGSVRITYTAGYPANGVPPALDDAVLSLIGHYYLNRETVIAGRSVAAIEIPFTVADLIAPYCMPGIG